MLCRADKSASVRAVVLRGEGLILMLLASKEGLTSRRGGAANAATIWTDRRKEDRKNMTCGRWSCSLRKREKRELMCLDIPLASSAQEG